MCWTTFFSHRLWWCFWLHSPECRNVIAALDKMCKTLGKKTRKLIDYSYTVTDTNWLTKGLQISVLIKSYNKKVKHFQTKLSKMAAMSQMMPQLCKFSEVNCVSVVSRYSQHDTVWLQIVSVKKQYLLHLHLNLEIFMYTQFQPSLPLCQFTSAPHFRAFSYFPLPCHPFLWSTRCLCTVCSVCGCERMLVGQQ